MLANSTLRSFLYKGGFFHGPPAMQSRTSRYSRCLKAFGGLGSGFGVQGLTAWDSGLRVGDLRLRVRVLGVGGYSSGVSEVCMGF